MKIKDVLLAAFFIVVVICAMPLPFMIADYWFNRNEECSVSEEQSQ